MGNDSSIVREYPEFANFLFLFSFRQVGLIIITRRIPSQFASVFLLFCLLTNVNNNAIK